MPLNPTEYLSVLVSIVVGLGISHLLSGTGKLVVARRRVSMYAPTLMAVLLVFLAHVQFWWGNLGYGEEVEGNFFAFLAFLVGPVLLFLMSVLVLPDFDKEGELSLQAHYEENRPWFFGIALALPLTSALRNVLVQGDPVFTAERPFEIVFAALALSGLLVRTPRWHTILGALLLTLFASMMLLTGLQPG
ncbi:MAG TPA: hypothetical protein VGB24_16390 [Longimicrobium sp.]|jgi:hypothetical protein|uniref:hypothetical protein n=1 Tax=Longimicrobium sp. TaxID=2029185 RepID=UPI002ED9B2A4